MLPKFFNRQSSIAIVITTQIAVTEGGRELLLGCAMTVSDMHR